MKPSLRQTAARWLTAAAVLALAQPSDAHSWVERLRRLSSNGTMVGPVGYMRGYVDRSNPIFNDGLQVNLIPANGLPYGKVVLPTDFLGRESQRTSNYTAEYPMLTSAPGDYIALQYQENGHVTQPWIQPAKPNNRGTVYIYGTSQPNEDEKLLDVLFQWTEDGQGGDKRGRLLATRNFDDGQCYQINNGNISEYRQQAFNKTAENPQGANLWCQNDVQLPADIPVNSTYVLYWIWNWPTFNAPGNPTDVPAGSGNGSAISPAGNATGSATAKRAAASSSLYIQYPEIYTSIISTKIVDPCSDELGEVKAPTCNSSSSSSASSYASSSSSEGISFASSFIKGQDLNWAAVKSQLSKLFLVQNPGPQAPVNAPGTSISQVESEAAAAASASASLSPLAVSSPSSSSSSSSSSSTISSIGPGTTTISSAPTVGSVGGILTVTVTDVVATATVTDFVTSSQPLVAEAAPTTTAGTTTTTVATTTTTVAGLADGPPKVTPFLAFAQWKRLPRRAAGEWKFGY